MLARYILITKKHTVLYCWEYATQIIHFYSLILVHMADVVMVAFFVTLQWVKNLKNMK